jgi:hypothetical protein
MRQLLAELSVVPVMLLHCQGNNLILNCQYFIVPVPPLSALSTPFASPFGIHHNALSRCCRRSEEKSIKKLNSTRPLETAKLSRKSGTDVLWKKSVRRGEMGSAKSCKDVKSITRERTAI